MNQKSNLRKMLLNKRALLNEQNVKNNFSNIFHTFSMKMNQYSVHILENKNIALFSPLAQEADFHLFIDFFNKKRAHLFFPVIQKNNSNEMHFYPATLDLNTRWTPNKFGILEPEQTHSLSKINEKSFFLMFLPCVAISTQGDRLGMGKGFYDRFLIENKKELQNCLKISCVHDFQILNDWKADPWDQKTDWIISETRSIELPNFSHWEKNHDLIKH